MLISIFQTTQFVLWPNNFYSAVALAVAHLQDGCHRQYWERVPPQGTIIPPRGTYTYQARLKPGTYIRAIQHANNFLFFQLVDADTGLEAFEQPQGGGGFVKPFYTASGRVDVKMFSNDDNPMTPVALLEVIEPIER